MVRQQVSGERTPVTGSASARGLGINRLTGVTNMSTSAISGIVGNEPNVSSRAQERIRRVLGSRNCSEPLIGAGLSPAVRLIIRCVRRGNAVRLVGCTSC